MSIDLSGSIPLNAQVPSPDPVSAPLVPEAVSTTPAPEQTQVAVPAVPSVVAPQPTLTKQLEDVVDGIVRDLSGVSVSEPASLLRFVPRLASSVHSLQIRGAEKRDLVMSAAHLLVSRVIPEPNQTLAHGMIDAMFPPAIAAVIDVVAGRVTFEQIAASAAEAVTSPATAAAVVSSSGNCLTQILSACLRKN
jgi:hypothetical protein